jgi:predicted ribosome quality control (RQC) complex YloA/Tae2 family protein
VGKTSRDNDHLTQKLARSEDFWLHVGGFGGSHVILRNPARLAIPPHQSLLEAAQLAAYFSQARNAAKVEVHYTQKKHVSKPRGVKAGLVTLRQFKSIRVTPKLI